MRYIFIALILLCCLALPAFAAESAEATQTRVRDLEKANVSLRSDLARTQLTLDAVNTTLKKTQATLAEQIALTTALKSELDAEREARKALETKLAQLLAAEEIARKAADTKLAEADAAMDAANKQALAALTEQFSKEVASLKDTLDAERKERLAAEAAAAEMDAKLVKQDKKNRTLTYILSGLLAGAVVATN